MNTKKITGYFAAMAILGASVSAFAQSGTQFSQDGRAERIFTPMKGFNDADARFLKNAAIANMFEIESSKLALKKSSDPFVTEFAKEMITDHTGSLEELKGVADKRNFALPQDLPGPQKRIMEKLESLNGSDFDMAYEKAQKEGHAQASTLFKGEIRHGQDEDAKNYATKTLPTVVMHYKMMLMKKTMMGPTKMEGGG